MALVIVTHELGVAARPASRVEVFDRIAEEADLPTLLRNAAHPTSAQVLAAAGMAIAHRGPDRALAPLLQARRLRVEYPRRGRCPGVVAVDSVDLDARADEAVGVAGNSGCGKSCLARALAGIERHASGSVRLDGHPIRGRDDRAQLVFQDPATALDRPRRIGAAVSEALWLSKVAAAARPQRTRALLERVGLSSEHAARRRWQLSGGERQRAVIARSLVGQRRRGHQPVPVLDPR